MNQATVVVLGASGGVGASTLASAIALRGCRAGLRATAVDLRPYGGGLDVVVGAEQEPGLRWDGLVGLAGRADGAAIVERLPRSEEVAVLSFGREDPTLPDEAVVAEVLPALRAAQDLVVIDVGAAVPYAEAALRTASLTVLVGGSGLSQLAALCAVGRWAETRCREVVVCLRGDQRLGELVAVVESVTGLDVVALLPHDRKAGADLVHGVPPGARGRGPVVDGADACLALAVQRGRDAGQEAPPRVLPGRRPSVA